MGDKTKDVSPDVGFSAPLWVQKNAQKFLGRNRIDLLEQIQECGSLSKAAKAAGMSYKAAWDALNAMNNLADRPLTTAMTGGKDGGGTCLTDEGKKLVHMYKVIEEEHLKTLAKLQRSLDDFDSFYPLLKRISMRISAKNVFSGTVCDVVREKSVAQVVLQLRSGNRITAVIGSDSVDQLGLKVGAQAYALVKASSVMIGKNTDAGKISAKNILSGKIIGIKESMVIGEVVLDIGEGETVTANITETSVKNLELVEGDEVCAVIKSTNVIVGVE